MVAADEFGSRGNRTTADSSTAAAVDSSTAAAVDSRRQYGSRQQYSRQLYSSSGR